MTLNCHQSNKQLIWESFGTIVQGIVLQWYHKIAISSSRKALIYALMGAGLHGANGLTPKVSYQLVKIYVLPRLIYGLDVVRFLVRLAAKDLAEMSAYYKKILKQIQHLPDRTSDAATYLLLGALPLEAEIHRKVLTTFVSICRDFDSVENQLAWRQLSLKSSNSTSWFIYAKTLLQKYDLPSVYDLLEQPLGKHTWKRIAYTAIDKFWDQKLKDEANTKSTLKYLNIQSMEIGKTHPVWDSAGTEVMAVRKASVKCKILVGQYILQANRHRFNQFFSSKVFLHCLEQPSASLRDV